MSKRAVPAAVEAASLCLARYKIGSASSFNSSIPETGRLTQPREHSLCIWDAVQAASNALPAAALTER